MGTQVGFEGFIQVIAPSGKSFGGHDATIAEPRSIIID
jgi:hypothetical protein